MPGLTVRDGLVHETRGSGIGSLQLTAVVVDKAITAAGCLGLDVSIHGVPKPSSYSKPDTTLLFMRKDSDGTDMPAWESLPARQTTSPRWNIKIPA